MEDQRRIAKRGLPSLVIARTVKGGGFQISVSVEDAFWVALKEIATSKGMPLYELVLQIDRKRVLDRENANLSSAIRVFVLTYYCELAEAKR